ncbi:MAG: hypothetical protein J3Q66DRAFT_52807 [Benniella sp.]|nr:MAG: hypothetical protein J3Q66DRAFT_52807 [Benniella sp.]
MLVLDGSALLLVLTTIDRPSYPDPRAATADRPEQLWHIHPAQKGLVSSMSSSVYQVIHVCQTKSWLLTLSTWDALSIQHPDCCV